MKIIFQSSLEEVARMTTAELRKNFLLENLMEPDGIHHVYFHYDRLIVTRTMPLNNKINLDNPEELKSDNFLDRREIGIINVGGTGEVIADNIVYTLEKLSCLYLGTGTKNVCFRSLHSNKPANFFAMSAPAHHKFPNAFMPKENASAVRLGEQATANKRTIHKYIHTEGIQSCQLVMGLTILDEGSVWNSIPPHTHTRRTEVYFYFDLNNEQRIFHFMGEPHRTRHLVMNNYDTVISPPGSLHFGCGSSNYSFIWGMAGENKTFTDMDTVTLGELK